MLQEKIRALFEAEENYKKIRDEYERRRRLAIDSGWNKKIGDKFRSYTQAVMDAATKVNISRREFTECIKSEVSDGKGYSKNMG